jgi:glycosyltransferase involved in cell wall biosynthesis
MPHVWTPLFGREIRRRGIRYITIIHDALKHPGDRTGRITGWLRSEARFADRVITLSRVVAHQLLELKIADAERTRTLFLPDLRYDSAPIDQKRDFSRPLRLLFFGRILRYKGLPMLLRAIELLRLEGTHIELGIAGTGDLGKESSRLAALGAEVINRWLDDDEVGRLLARYDAMVLPYLEASQSGVAAMAFGACMPIICTPVGGMVEQVVDGQTGILASRATAGALADAIRRLAVDRGLCGKISGYLRQTSPDRSMRRFLHEIVAESATGARRH